jgi:D-alanyl-D-alanine endopeptidase (penicillin-binding protein 7)
MFRAALKALSAAGLVLALAALPVASGFAAAKNPSAAESTKSPRGAKVSKSSRATPVKASRQARSGKLLARQAKRPTRTMAAPAAQPQASSIGQMIGLHATPDPLDLKSSVAFVVDQETDEVLVSKNSTAVLPIASITKLMTALVVTEAGLPLDEVLTVTPEDAAVRAGSSRQLRAGAQLTRGEMLHLALMASENRAAYLLGRTYPGGLPAFVEAMNAKASLLGMHDTRYVEPTGLSSDNRSSAEDLARLVRAASRHALLRELSTSPEAVVPVGRQQVQFRNTNGLVRNPEWEIGLQKTGYIAAAGRCLVMQTQLAGRQLIMVLLDSAGRYSRIGDAERIRQWLAAQSLASVLPAAQGVRALQPL